MTRQSDKNQGSKSAQQDGAPLAALEKWVKIILPHLGGSAYSPLGRVRLRRTPIRLNRVRVRQSLTLPSGGRMDRLAGWMPPLPDPPAGAGEGRGVVRRRRCPWLRFAGALGGWRWLQQCERRREYQGSIEGMSPPGQVVSIRPAPIKGVMSLRGKTWPP
jgi:hypothetical protein